MLVIGFLAIWMLTGSGGMAFFEPGDQQKRDAAIFKLNQGTPRDVGNGAQLDSVVAVDEGVQYRFTMTELSVAEISAAEFRDFIYENARPQICSHPQLVGFFDTEAGFVEYQINDRDGAFLAEIRFDKSDCR